MAAARVFEIRGVRGHDTYPPILSFVLAFTMTRLARTPYSRTDSTTGNRSQPCRCACV